MRDFLRAGHLPTLMASLLHFGTSCMVWVLLGGLGVLIAADLGLSPSQKGLLVAIPLLGGAACRVPVGLLADRCGAKGLGTAILVGLLVPLALAWRVAADLPGLMLVGLLLGLAGGSFAVALPLASRSYAERYRGTAMGIVAAGNSGTVLAGLFAPRLGEAVGWQGVCGLAMVPVLLTAGLFRLLAREQPHPPGDSTRSALALLRHADLWWLALLYTMTFGGYAGFSTFLAIYFHDQYGLSPVSAGLLLALCAATGGLLRPLGGAMADRLGGDRVLSGVYAAVPLCLVGPIAGAPLPVCLAGLVVAMAGLGIGNGAVFQLVPRRFSAQVGLATGVTGAAGGLGGFLLPVVLGLGRELTGSYGPGFLLYAVSLAYMWLCLQALRTGWQFTWLAASPGSGRLPRAEAEA